MEALGRAVGQDREIRGGHEENEIEAAARSRLPPLGRLLWKTQRLAGVGEGVEKVEPCAGLEGM